MAETQSPPENRFSVARSEAAARGNPPPPQKLRGFDFTLVPEDVVRAAQHRPHDGKIEAAEVQADAALDEPAAVPPAAKDADKIKGKVKS